jgi:hypothetical protein
VNIVDLSHGIPPYDIRKAAYLIASAYPYFAVGTIHVVVVDPGVGGERDIILLQAGGHLFLAPDNGVLGLIIQKHPEAKVFRVTNRDLFLNSPSPTFHGRDIFAPVAAHLARGAGAMTVGPEIAPEHLRLSPFPQPISDHIKKQMTGTVINIDHFGNCMTNICKASLKEISADQDQDSFSLSIGQNTLSPLKKSYQQAEVGDPLILFNSRNYLEIAVNQGNAARTLKISPDDQVFFNKL